MVNRKRFVFLLVFIATAGLYAQPADVPTALKAKAAATGQMPVIVGLNLPGPGFKPEGLLPGAAAVAQQRSAIAATRKLLLNSLQGLNAQEYRSWESVPSVALKVDAAALDFLAHHPLVTTIQEDALSAPTLASATNFIGADVTFAAGFGGLGQAVAILDTGIDAPHPFYGGDGTNASARIIEQACFSNGGGGGVSLCNAATTGPGAADVTVNPMADATHCDTAGANLCAHGSHVAGIAAGRDPGGINATGFNGIAPQASIIAIQVFTRFNTNASCNNAPPCVAAYTSDQISALNYVNTTLFPLHPGIVSVNMSLGDSTRNTVACDGDSRKAPIDNLLSNNITTAIAAGNNGFTDGVSTPGCISTAVTVGSVGDGSGACGGQANVADALSSFSNMGNPVDLLAVGECVDSSIPVNATANFNGTSMSTPEVTGAFAMLRAINTGQTAAQILNLLVTTGVPVTDQRPICATCTNTGTTKPRINLVAAAAQLLTADLKVTKTCPPNPTPVGQTATCSISVQNLGPDPALNVSIVDQLTSSGTFNIGTVTPGAPTCTKTPNPQVGSGTVTCALPSLASGSTATITVDVSASTRQDINDVVTASSLSSDPDLTNNSASGTVHVAVELTALSPATVFVGLTNSDDVGLYFDLLAEVLVNGNVVGSGEKDKVWGGSSGFNNAVKSIIPLILPNPAVLPANSTFSIRVSVRQACTAPRERYCVHPNECKARLWYNDQQADDNFDATIAGFQNGVNTDYFLLNGFVLGTAPGPGPKKTSDVGAGARCSPFKSFGTWSITVP